MTDEARITPEMVSLGVRKRAGRYYAECQIPHGNPVAEKGPFDTLDEAKAAARDMTAALQKEMLKRGHGTKATHLTLEQAMRLVQKP